MVIIEISHFRSETLNLGLCLGFMVGHVKHQDQPLTMPLAYATSVWQAMCWNVARRAPATSNTASQYQPHSLHAWQAQRAASTRQPWPKPPSSRTEAASVKCSVIVGTGCTL